MANHPSAERRNRQRIKRTARNRAVKSAVRTSLRKARAAIGTTKPEELKPLLQSVESALDRAAVKGIMHKKAASRAKSRLYKRMAKALKATAT